MGQLSAEAARNKFAIVLKVGRAQTVWDYVPVVMEGGRAAPWSIKFWQAISTAVCPGAGLLRVAVPQKASNFWGLYFQILGA